MTSLFFVIIKSLKNMFLQTVKKPLKLILIIFFIGMIALQIITVAFTGSDIPLDELLDINYLYAIVFALLTLFVSTSLIGGAEKGGSFFRMSDVNFVFNAPISTKKILIYGLVRSLGTVFLLSFFILFYGAMLQDMFGISYDKVVVIMIIYLITLFASQLLTVVVYSFTSGNEKLKKIIKYTTYAVLLAVLGATYILSSNLEGGFNITNACTVLANNVMPFVPLSGFMVCIFKGILLGNMLTVVLFSALSLVIIVALLILFFKAKPDFFEDVLQATESAHAMIEANKEGKLTTPNRKVKVNSSEKGITKGFGWSVFFFKHFKEYARKGILPFIDLFSLVMIISSIVASKFFTDTVDMPYFIPVVIVLAANVYLMIFSMSITSWNNELNAHYIYLIPDSPFKKIVGAISFSIIKPLMDSVIGFLIVAIFSPVSKPIDCLCAVVTYLSFSLLLTTVNLLGQRIFGHAINKGLSLLIFVFMVLILIAPSIVFGIILGLIAGQFFVGLLVGAIINIIISGVIVLIASLTFNSIEQ